MKARIAMILVSGALMLGRPAFADDPAPTQIQPPPEATQPPAVNLPAANQPAANQKPPAVMPSVNAPPPTQSLPQGGTPPAQALPSSCAPPAAGAMPPLPVFGSPATGGFG